MEGVIRSNGSPKDELGTKGIFEEFRKVEEG